MINIFKKFKDGLKKKNENFYNGFKELLFKNEIVAN